MISPRHVTLALSPPSAKLLGRLRSLAVAQPHFYRPHVQRRRHLAESALNYSLTGPILRATGVNYDVAQGLPYLVYDQMDFDSAGRAARATITTAFVCRMQRDRAEHAASSSRRWNNCPSGPVWIDDPRFVLPEKEKVYDSIEGLMHHFKIIMEGIHVPAGETYFAVEGGNGELGFYIVSDGGGKPYRVRVRPPCFIAMGAFARDDQRPHGRRHHPDLRHDQHDRRGVRSVEEWSRIEDGGSRIDSRWVAARSSILDPPSSIP